MAATKKTSEGGKKIKGFSDEEKAAMKEYAKELNSKTEGEGIVMAKIATMPEPDRGLAKRLHEIIKKNAPSLIPKTWYGMPAYATREGKIVCFFQGAYKFKYRYATLGFQQDAHLDEGTMWPTSFAVTKLTPEVESKVAALVKKAVK